MDPALSKAAEPSHLTPSEPADTASASKAVEESKKEEKGAYLFLWCLYFPTRFLYSGVSGGEHDAPAGLFGAYLFLSLPCLLSGILGICYPLRKRSDTSITVSSADLYG